MRTITTVEQLNSIPNDAIILDKYEEVWRKCLDTFYEYLEPQRLSTRTAQELIDGYAPLQLLYPVIDTKVTPESLRIGDEIEVHKDSRVRRGKVGGILYNLTGIIEILSESMEPLWSAKDPSDIYLVNVSPNRYLPTTPGSILTRSVIHGEETSGPIMLCPDGNWASSKLVNNTFIHSPEDITDWTEHVGHTI